MILEIVQYGHPALRAKGRRIDKVDEGLLQLIDDMIETMYDADGVGLAAQQIGRPLQLCVIDVAGVKDRPSAMRIGGKPVDITTLMPLVLINPEVEPYGKERKATEGCLSFPGVRADIIRPGSVRVKAHSPEGELIEFEADGLLARAVQHENDHLQGVLFIDHLSSKARQEIEAELQEQRADRY
jgi:peptide deformylase